MRAVIDMAELRRMSPADRRELAGLLAELDKPAPAAPAPGTACRRARPGLR